MAGEGNLGKLAALLKIIDPTNAADLKLAYGQHTTVAASDSVSTGLTTVLGCIAVLDDDPVLTCDRATAVKPASGGSITIKTWKPTGAGDTTPIAATTFTKKVNWIAIGR